MSPQQKMLRNAILLTVSLLFLLAGSVLASNLDATLSGEPAFRLQNPEDRMQEWREGFLRFAANRPDLNEEQAYALQNLADLDDPSFFEPALAAKKRELLAERLDELRRVLPYRDYLQLLRSFGELRVWLVQNELASQQETDTPTCNCGDSEDCSGAVCQNVTCIHEGGTSHKGRCPSTET